MCYFDSFLTFQNLTRMSRWSLLCVMVAIRNRLIWPQNSRRFTVALVPTRQLLCLTLSHCSNITTNRKCINILSCTGECSFRSKILNNTFWVSIICTNFTTIMPVNIRYLLWAVLLRNCILIKCGVKLYTGLCSSKPWDTLLTLHRHHW